MQYEDVKRLGQWKDILSIKVRKQEKKSSINHLTVDGIKLPLEKIPVNTRAGRRNFFEQRMGFD